MIVHLVLAALGGGIGAALRYSVIRLMEKMQKEFFVATFLVNSIGSFFIGIAMHRIIVEPHWYALLATGILGGFTTFSTFAFDVVRLMEGKQRKTMIFYSLLTLSIGILAVAIGYAI